jgi:hypothetical protein
MNHVLALPSYFLKTHFNIFLHLCLDLKVLSSLRFSPTKPIYARPLPYAPHVLPTSFCYLNVVCVGVRILKLLTMTFSLGPCYFFHRSPKYVSRQNILILQSMFLPQYENQVSHPHETTGKIMVLLNLILIFVDGRRDGTRFRAEWLQAFPVFNSQLIYSCL